MLPKAIDQKQKRRPKTKKGKKLEETAQGSDVPTDKAWQMMKPASKYISENATYRPGMDVVFNSLASEQEEWWIGKIIELRLKQDAVDASGAWAKVQWYYSAKDIENLENPPEGFDPKSLSALERLFSDHYDYELVTTFSEPVTIYTYDENSYEPPIFDEDCFFHRFDLIYTNEKQATLSPDPVDTACLCGVVYDPFPKHVNVAQFALRKFKKTAFHSNPGLLEVQADYMHFCPRPGCGRWFHEVCLVAETLEAENSLVGPPEIRWLAVDPDSQEIHFMLKQFMAPRPPHGKSSGSDGYYQPVTAILKHLLRLEEDDELPLPETLINIAASPILRCAGTGIKGFSTAGNVSDVVAARRMVYEMLDGGLTKLEKVYQQLPPAWHEDENLHTKVWQFLSTYRCLAVPLGQYWDRAMEKLDHHGSRPVYHCPSCSSDTEFPVCI